MTTTENDFSDFKKHLSEHRVVLYMKGTPKFPQCGFSHHVAQLMMKHQLDFGYVDVLSHPDIRKRLPLYSQWPTFPQIFIDGTLIGGCDIFLEMERNGEISALIEELALSQEGKISSCI
ncbi:MAG: Grx4 family monothiol glutaredoxin [Gammaproteobacteria bacterium]|nr:Grx4 family monothiol glutaredoxin [Gammaproteobacteria bacterium]